jgi:signal transduction histidine kinase
VAHPGGGDGIAVADLRRPHPPVMVNYGVAAFSTAAALAIARVLEIGLVSAPVSLFLCAIIFSAWFGGVGPGLFAAALSHLGFVYYFVSPAHSLAFAAQEIPRVVLFTLSAIFVLLLTAAQRRATQSLSLALDDLGRTVHALKDSNQALQAENAERKRAERALEVLAGRLIDAQEEERRRIGRELHDHISQMLGVLTIKVDQLRADDAHTPRVARALDDLRHDASLITDDVHRLSHRLHSSTLDYLGLVTALHKLVSDFSDRYGILITFAHTSVPRPLPADVALCLFRVAEESLTNIAKHSHARTAQVHVAGLADGIRLTVQDAGKGFDMHSVQNRGGLGFVSMQERLRALQGTIRVDSAPAQGTRIDAWLPAMMLANARHENAQRSDAVRTGQQP